MARSAIFWNRTGQAHADARDTLMMNSGRLKLVVKRAVALSALVGLAACAPYYYNNADPVTLSAGNAVAANKAAQTIDPLPRHAGRVAHRTDGERVGIAIERYRTNRTLEPEGLTSSVDDQGAAGPTGPSAPPQ